MDKNKKADLTIGCNFGQDEKEAKKFSKDMGEVLKSFKKIGLVDSFKMVTKRKCDFCDKILEKGDKFKTIGEKDKCQDCQKNGK